MKFKFGPFARERFKTAKAIKEQYRAGRPESWKIGWGDFKPFYKHEIGEPWVFHKRETEGELQDLERIVHANLLAKLQETTAEHPVIAVDFGGMYGLSFMRIAHALQEYIHDERLIMVVTNLYKPTDNLDGMELSREQQAFMRENKHLLHYVSADAAELRKLSVSMWGGRKVKLAGSIDILHESYALEHGMQNDVDLAILAQSMREGGLFFTTLADDSIHPASHRVTREVADSRQEAHRIGMQNLEELGVHELQTLRPANYKVLGKGDAIFLENPEAVSKT